MSNKSTVLILGTGPRVGTSAAQKFIGLGANVAVVSRKGTAFEGAYSLQADFSNSDSVPGIFESVTNKFGTAPNVIIYNAATLTPPPVETSVLSVPAEALKNDLNINTLSAYVAAQEAIRGWETLPKETKKTFIYTGNWLNKVVMPVGMMLTLGIGKSASSYWIEAADALYASQGYRFFYADERYADGKSKGLQVDGPAHADFFAQLAEHEGTVPSQATFVVGQGYVKF